MTTLKIAESGGVAIQELVSIGGQEQAHQKAPSFLAQCMESHDPRSLTSWVALYWRLHVIGSPHKTMVAKRQDIERFLRFFALAVGGDAIDDWTPVVSKGLVLYAHYAYEATGCGLGGYRVISAIGWVAKTIQNGNHTATTNKIDALALLGKQLQSDGDNLVRQMMQKFAKRLWRHP